MFNPFYNLSFNYSYLYWCANIGMNNMCIDEKLILIAVIVSFVEFFFVPFKMIK